MAITERKIVFITGATSGVGFETVKALMQSSQLYHIFVGCLVLKEGVEAVEVLLKDVPESRSTLEPVEVDLGSDQSINQCFEQVQSATNYIDVLINNAGIALRPTEIGIREAYNKCYDINVTGTQVFTHTMAPLLIRSEDPRLIFLASGLSCLSALSTAYTPTRLSVPAGWPKPEIHPYQAYRPSKTALNMIMLEWHWQLKEDGVKTWGVSPGFLATTIGTQFSGMTGAPPVLHPSVGGKLIVSVVEGHRDDDVGKLVLNDGGIQAY